MPRPAANFPNLQDLAQAVGGHHGHHHHSQGASDSDAGSSGSSSSASSASQTLSQFLTSLQANGAQSGSLNPATIILNTLTSAGIGISNG